MTILKGLRIRPYKTLFVCPSGKAACELIKKGIPAKTIAKQFYRLWFPGGQLENFEEEPVFIPKTTIKELAFIDAIVIDESGMVEDKVIVDILKHDKMVIMLGDHKQLPCIKGTNTFITDPDIYLTETFRSDLPILDAALEGYEANEYSPLRPKDYAIKYGKENQEVRSMYRRDFDPVRYQEFDMILCFSNKTRREINFEVRRQLGLSKHRYPQDGEKIVCLKNNYKIKIKVDKLDLNIANGMLGYCKGDTKVRRDGTLSFGFNPDFVPDIVDVNPTPKPFNMYYDDVTIDDVAKKFTGSDKGLDKFDFAYCISVHKSQGSEARKVLLIDDHMHRKGKAYNRFMYTGITRAKDEIVILLKDPK